MFIEQWARYPEVPDLPTRVHLAADLHAREILHCLLVNGMRSNILQSLCAFKFSHAFKRDNGNVHRAASKVIVPKSREARGSLCNVLLSGDLPIQGCHVELCFTSELTNMQSNSPLTFEMVKAMPSLSGKLALAQTKCSSSSNSSLLVVPKKAAAFKRSSKSADSMTG